MPTIFRLPRWSIWMVLILLGAVAFVHLDADFPNHSRWVDDGARFTDEGWWASGAMNHILTGKWLVPGDYNTGISLPLWTLLLEFIFHFTGIHVELARALAFCFTIGTVLVCGALLRRERPAFAPVLMLLVGTSPVLYFYSRMALLEPALIFFLMAAALAAYSAKPLGSGRAFVCGLLCMLAMFTKTTAVFVAPAIFYLLWFPHRRLWLSKLAEDQPDRWRAIRAVLIPSIVVVVGYGTYWLLVLHTHPVDVRTFYGNNAPNFDSRAFEKAARLVYRCFTWVDWIVFPMAGIAVLLSFWKLSFLWKNPLFVFAVLFFCGYGFFMVIHFDAEPHYFPVLAVPVMILAVLFADALRTRMPQAFTMVGAVLLLAAVLNVGYIVKHLIHPEYTFRDACLDIRSRILADRSPGPLLIIGHGAMETTYFTHIPALDDLGVMTVEDKIATYQPGWVTGWSGELSAFTTPEFKQKYTLVEEAHYHAFDQPGRDLLYLFRIQPR